MDVEDANMDFSLKTVVVKNANLPVCLVIQEDAIDVLLVIDQMEMDVWNALKIAEYVILEDAIVGVVIKDLVLLKTSNVKNVLIIVKDVTHMDVIQEDVKKDMETIWADLEYVKNVLKIARFVIEESVIDVI